VPHGSGALELEGQKLGGGLLDLVFPFPARWIHRGVVPCPSISEAVIEMVDEQELKMLKTSSHELSVTVALLCLAKGIPAVKVLADLYHEGQRSVTDDPQAWGLIGGRA